MIEAQDISSVKVPKENGSVDSTDISITESQFSSIMPYCEESLVAKIDPMGTNQFLSAQPCHKEDTASAHESVNLTVEKGNSISDTEVSASDAFDSKIPANDINAKIDSVPDFDRLGLAGSQTYAVRELNVVSERLFIQPMLWGTGCIYS